MIIEEKYCGETMSVFLNRIQQKYMYPVTYTTRLDPMAQGKVSLISKNEFKNINRYFNSNKKYTVKVILGYQTDSDDVLGLIERKNIKDFDISKLKPYFERSNFTYNQKYHYFSSKRNSKRRNNKDTNFSHQVTIYNSKVLSSGTLSFFHWKNQVIMDIDKIDKQTNFRQEEIIKQWLSENNSYLYFVDLELDVSSGFFVRQFIRDIIEETGIPMLAYRITRQCIVD